MRLRVLVVASIAMALGARAGADTTYQSPDAFLHEVFAGAPPAASVLWLGDDAQRALTPIFGHPYPQARLRYWRANGRTAWILDDVGKELPITAAFVVHAGTIELARVLIYRESRGSEISFAGFLAQFVGIHLSGEQIEPKVDGISGATLSVDAMRRMAHAALTLDALAK